MIHKIVDECGCVDRGNRSELALMGANIDAMVVVAAEYPLILLTLPWFAAPSSR